MPAIVDAAIGHAKHTYRRLRWRTKAQNVQRYGASPREHLPYVLTSLELENFTYDLANEDELARWCAELLGAEPGRCAELLLEGRSNPDIHEALRRHGLKMPLGRRLGWYVVVRVLKPQRVVETGIHDGLGSLTLLSALERNAAEGADGDLVSFDPVERSGWLVGSHPRWTPRLIGAEDGLAETLAERPTQLFIHDSLHTYEHERMELELAADGMTEGILLSDNSHATTALKDLCDERGLRYSFFAERPRDHFYPGAGIGAAVLRDS